jgi:hypothetical protein
MKPEDYLFKNNNKRLNNSIDFKEINSMFLDNDNNLRKNKEEIF